MAKRIIYADPIGKIALQGYDPVSFHSVGKPEKGDPEYTKEYDGYTFVFASAANRATFSASPEKYLPDFGGYCAFGISVGVFFPVEIDTWELVDGRLVLQYNQVFKKEFEKDKAANLKKARENWKRIEAGGK